MFFEIATTASRERPEWRLLLPIALARPLYTVVKGSSVFLGVLKPGSRFQIAERSRCRQGTSVKKAKTEG